VDIGEENTATQAPQPTPRTLEDFRRRRRLLEGLRNEDAKARLSGFIDWMDGEPSVKPVVESVEKSVPAADLLAESNRMQSPDTRSPEDVAGVGLFLMRKVATGEELWEQSLMYGIEPPYSTNNVQEMASEVLNRYIYPALDHLEFELESRVQQPVSHGERTLADLEHVESPREPVKLSTPGGTYVHPKRIEELASLKVGAFDFAKLLELLREINVCHENRCYLATAALVRTVLDHVPPIFGCKTFSEVANNFGGSRSFKESMAHLDNSARKIADQHLHVQIRKSEVLPTIVQVDFSNDFDLLLSEIIRILKQ
jgi:hypothetical protein